MTFRPTISAFREVTISGHRVQRDAVDSIAARYDVMQIAIDLPSAIGFCNTCTGKWIEPFYLYTRAAIIRCNTHVVRRHSFQVSYPVPSDWFVDAM